MRAGCDRALGVMAGLVALAGCSADGGGQCAQGFCLPADAVIVGREEPADFTLYQLAWRSEQFGLYVGDQPTFNTAAASPFAVPLDREARLVTGGGSAELLMKLGDTSPRYLHLAGRCDAIETCTFADLARAITREGR
jgi:hypothetical protein